MLIAERSSDVDFKSSGFVKQARRVTILADQSVNLDYEDNDDVERFARRRSRLVDPHTETVSSPAQDAALRAAASHFMPRAQVGEHYGNCIRLAAENKITYKNAFDLHLIDFMGEMILQEDASSFRMASSSLDASAKIYAGRVDAVHQETYKVLTGLGRSDKKTDENGNENADGVPDADAGYSGDELGDRGTAAERRKRDRRRAAANAKPVIVTMLSKIRSKVKASDADVDPLFQQQAAAYDDGGTVELRLNRLRTHSKFSELLQDSSTPLFRPYSEVSALTCCTRPLELLPSIDSRALEAPLCIAFDDFHFNKVEDGADDRPDVPPLSPVFVLEDDPFEGPASPLSIPHSPVDTDGSGDFLPPMTDEAHNETVVEETKMAVRFAQDRAVEDNNNGSSKNDTAYLSEGGEGEIFVSSLKSMLTAHLENFGQVNDGILGLWAGPEHWRKKAKRRRLDEFGNVAAGGGAENQTEVGKSARSKATTKSKLLKFEYSSAVLDAGENRSKSGFLVRGEWSSELAIYSSKSGKSPVLREQNRRLANERFNLLAPSITDARQHTYELCNREVISSLTEKRRQGVMALASGTGGNGVASADQGDIIPPWLENQPGDANADVADQNEFNGVDLVDVGDDDDDDVDAGFGGFDGIFTQGNEDVVNVEDMDVYGGMPGVGGEGDLVELVAPPRQIARLEVRYARAAKLINVRHLKSVLWNMVETSLSPHPPSKRSRVEGQTEADSNPNEGGPVPASFSKLLTGLPHLVSKQTAGDLSVAIGLNCLLHLANEKDLFLETCADCTDLSISQGLSAAELDLLTEYQGSRSAKNRRQKKQTSLDHWLDGVGGDQDDEHTDARDD